MNKLLLSKTNIMPGTLDIITGPMFSGKSTELLRRLFTESEVGLNVLYINHKDDTRGGDYSIHNPLYKQKIEGSNVKFIYLNSLMTFDSSVASYDVIGIDEAQFFDDLVKWVEKWVETTNVHFIISGLTGDFRRQKFGSLLDLEPMSDTFTKLRSYCKICALSKKRERAPFTSRKKKGKTQKVVGAKELYIPLCRKCYQNYSL